VIVNTVAHFFCLLACPVVVTVLSRGCDHHHHRHPNTRNPQALSGQGSSAEVSPSVLMANTVLEGLCCVVVIVGFTLYVAACISTINMDLCNMVIGVSLLVGVAFVAILCNCLDDETLEGSLMEIPLVKKLHGTFLSVWLKALIVLVGGPFSGAWILLQTLNTKVRAALACGHEKEHHNVDTKSLARSFSVMGVVNWPWAMVIDKALTLGLVFFVMQVRAL
jgi:hypothetical protein